jgi:hypothetical protein
LAAFRLIDLSFPGGHKVRPYAPNCFFHPFLRLSFRPGKGGEAVVKNLMRAFPSKSSTSTPERCYPFAMKKLLCSVAAIVLLSGCAADMVEKHGDAIHLLKLPGDKPGKGGVIRYLNGGMTAWKQARRANAEKQMQEFCKGPYTITAEGPRSKFGAEMPIGKSVSLEVDQYTYIRFECQ